MADNKEDQPSTQPESTNKEHEKLFLWRDIVYKQAYYLLGKYLPEAKPQEPTDIWIASIPGYRAKYKGVHQVAGIEDPQLLGSIERQIERLKHVNEKGWVEPISEPEDWDEPDRLLEGIHQYSTKSWRNVYLLTHELIHQRQAELHPASFPVLSDLEEFPDEELVDRIMATHKTWSRSFGNNSLFEPVIEGMAALGSYYVMGRFLDDLIKAGDIDVANRIKTVRNEAIRREIRQKPQAERDLNPYDPYSEGLGIMRKLYRKFGIENTPRILAAIDLQACQSIKQGSPEYQQIVENPTLLPGLQQAA